MTPAPETYICDECDKAVPLNRGVCPHCGYMSPWFKVRLYLGCFSVGIALLAFLAMILSAIFGIEPPTPPEVPPQP